MEMDMPYDIMNSTGYKKEKDKFRMKQRAVKFFFHLTLWYLSFTSVMNKVLFFTIFFYSEVQTEKKERNFASKMPELEFCKAR
jgi:hypothetical protein